MDWDAVKGIDKAWLEATLGEPELSGLQFLAMDEFAIRRGHRYATIFVEPNRKQVLWVCRGRSREDIRPFFETLGEEGRRRIEAVAMDMNGAYAAEAKRQTNRGDRRVIKGSRWLLLRNSGNLTRRDRVRLRELLTANRRVATAYVLKDDLKSLGDYRYRKWARRNVDLVIVVMIAKICRIRHDWGGIGGPWLRIAAVAEPRLATTGVGLVTATELFKISADALAITGSPEWDSPDAPGVRDALVYIDDDADEDGPLWALLPTGSETSDYVPIDTAMAHALINAHLRTWLLDRSWQTQVIVQKNAQRWRLADCLSLADGGGDRLDQDYPYGDDELAVLSESVTVVATSAAGPFMPY